MKLRETRNKVPSEQLEDAFIKPFNHRKDRAKACDLSWEEDASLDESSSFEESANPSEVIDLTKTPPRPFYFSRSHEDKSSTARSQVAPRSFMEEWGPKLREFEEQQRREWPQRRQRRLQQEAEWRAEEERIEREGTELVVMRVAGGGILFCPRDSPQTRIAWTRERVRKYSNFLIGFSKEDPLLNNFGEDEPHTRACC